jgi:hypothetical protein
VAVDRSQVDRPAGTAPWTEDIQPRRSGDQRSTNGGRPQHVTASSQSSIPAVDDEFCLKTRGAVSLQFGGTGLYRALVS